MDAIVCRGLTKRFGSVVALQNLDLSVPAGSIFGFLGPNGAGKSTTIRILATLSRPTAGGASVAGVDIVNDPDMARPALGYLPQHPAFPGWMRGREFLDFAADLSGMPGSSRPRIDEVLDLVGLSDAAGRRIGGYSGGMKQRLGLAQALLHRPAVLILDEPVSALDPLGRRDIIGIINHLRGETTVFLSSHILADIDRLCDHVAILAQGKLIAQETMDGLKARYAQPAFEIDVAGNVAPLAATLQGEPWVREVSKSGNRLRVLVHDVPYAERSLPQAVLDAGLLLVRYEQVLPTLEDVFVRLVGSGETAA